MEKRGSNGLNIGKEAKDMEFATKNRSFRTIMLPGRFFIPQILPSSSSRWYTVFESELADRVHQLKRGK